jgi:hypothetical protein
MRYFKTYLITLVIISILLFCGKEDPLEIVESCKSCKFAGQYSGVIHDIAGYTNCSGCVPYKDTMFTGDFLVQSLDNDRISILRLYDKYEWKFDYFSEKGCYPLRNDPIVKESFIFSGDTLKYFYSLSGGGGYHRLRFEGMK